MNFKHLLSGAAVAVAMSLSSVSAHAAGVLFDNGYSVSNSGGNNPMSQGTTFVAQDFVLGSASTLTGFVYNAYTRTNTVPVTDVDINIYDNNAGAPGALLYSGIFSVDSQTVTDTNVLGVYTLIDFHSVLPNWNLAAGTYFLGLHVEPDQFNMHWTIPTAATLPGSNYSSANGAAGTYAAYDFDHSFRIEGTIGDAVPEPTSWALMLTGFLGAGAMLRRRRQVAFAA